MSGSRSRRPDGRRTDLLAPVRPLPLSARARPSCPRPLDCATTETRNDPRERSAMDETVRSGAGACGAVAHGDGLPPAERLGARGSARRRHRRRRKQASRPPWWTSQRARSSPPASARRRRHRPPPRQSPARSAGSSRRSRPPGTTPAGCPQVPGSPGSRRTAGSRRLRNIDHSWLETRAEDVLERELSRPVLIINDADAAGLAEMRYGAGVGQHGVVLMLTIGTGIGSALFVDGRLVPNTGLGHRNSTDGTRRRWSAARRANGGSWAGGRGRGISTRTWTASTATSRRT